VGKWSKTEMKHLIIFLSILFLSTPLYSQETGALYLYKTSSGLVWKTIGDDKVQPKYNGEIKNGKPEGIGDLTAYDGGKYVGEYKDGKKHGQGKFTYTDGGWYDGSWKEGQSWTGITYDKDGNISYEKVNGEIQYKQ